MIQPIKFIILGALMSGSVLIYQTGAVAQVEINENVIADMSFGADNLPPQPSATSNENSVELLVEQVLVEAESPDDSVEPPDAPLVATELSKTQTTLINQDATPELIAIPHSGTYYDSSSLGGTGLTNSEAPREVDPRYEPGSSFVVVQKSAGANTIPARIVAAQRALDLGRYSSALELYEQLYRDNPKSHQVLMGLAVAQQENGFTESAIATYEELLKRDPSNADAVTNMLGLVKAQYPSVAFRRLRDLWEKNSTNPHIASELGLISASVSQFDEAIRYMGIAASLDPNNASHYYNMAVIYDRAGETKNAINLYQKSLEVDITYGAGRSIERDQVYDRLAQLRRL